MLQKCFGTLPQICASTQSCLGALLRIHSTSWLGFCSDIDCQLWDLILTGVCISDKLINTRLLPSIYTSYTHFTDSLFYNSYFLFVFSPASISDVHAVLFVTVLFPKSSEPIYILQTPYVLHVLSCY